MDLRLVCILLFIDCSFSVNRDNFKTCKMSSFCTRQRDFSPTDVRYIVIPESMSMNEKRMKANISRTDSEQILSLEITYLDFATFRVFIDEPASEQPRYRLPSTASLLNEPELLNMKSRISNSGVSLLGNLGDKMHINFNPFAIDLYIKDSLVVQMNHRNLFNFELKTDAPKHEEVSDSASSEEPMAETQETNAPMNEEVPPTEPHADDGSNQEAGGEHTEADLSENTTPNPTPTTPSPYPWSEHFKEHLDRRPYGPSSISLDIDFLDCAHLFGIPEHADSLFLKPTTSGDPYRLYNLDVFEYELNNPMALYGSVPVIWALGTNYTVGVFWHNPSETWVDVDYTESPHKGFFSRIPNFFGSHSDKRAKSRWISESGVLDVFVMVGRSPQDISKAYASLTGHTPLPPLFAISYHQSRWNYNDEADVKSLDERFDEHSIPVDVIWLDIEHTDGKRYFTWDSVKFPNPGAMVDQLNTKGRKLVTVVDPHLKQDSGWSIYNDGRAQHMFVKAHDGSDYIGWCWPGSSAWPDFLNPTVRDWWSNLFTKYEPVRTTTMFSWNDMDEPSVFSGPEVSMHKDAVHTGKREHRDVHNIYGLYTHRATWEGQIRRSNGLERPFVLTRAFFAGSQRTSAVWTGDNTADWNHLQISIPMLLSMSLTGITFCGADVGGFFGNPDSELLTRWYQAAAFQPFFRAHAHMDTKRREPWTLPVDYMKIVRSAIVDRYQLLPYWYTMFARAEADGQPVMAPLWYHFRDVPHTFDLDNVYMVGEALLVCPVTAAGARSWGVYLPPGTWYHYKSFMAYNGDQTIHIPVDLSTIPVFYRGGWIIPRRERIRRSSWLMRNDPFTLFVFLDPIDDVANGYLYDDDYHSTNRDTAQFYHIQYKATRDPGTNKLAGGYLRMHRIPIPLNQTASNYKSSQPVTQYIERIVVFGLQVQLQRATVREQSGVRRNVEFIQPVTKSADKHYHGTQTSGVVVIAQPELALSDTWELHLVTGNELLDEL